MSFLENIKRKLQTGSSQRRRIDSDVLERLAKTREAIYYYQSIKRTADRRRFATSLFGILEDFFKLCEDPIAREQIDNSIRALSSIQASTSNTSVLYEKVRSIQPEGYRLLGVAPPEDLNSLKNKYRSASKKYHPDAGGSDDQQQAINDAYDLLQNYLTKQIPETQSMEESAEESNLENFLTDLFNIYLHVASDNYDCDRCLSLANQQPKFKLWTVGEGRLKDYSSIIDDLYFFKSEITNNPGTLKAEYCGDVILLTCRRAVVYGFERERVGDIKLKLDEWWEKQKRKRNPEKSIWVFRSAEQVENAHNLGVITDDRYQKLFSKYNERSQAEEAAFTAIKSYAEKPGFILNLGIYPVDLARMPPKEFVPEPMYFCERFSHLDMDQQTEYLSMLTSPVKIEVVKKYLYQRLVAYCVAVVKNFDGLDWNRISTEIQLLSALGGSSSSYTATYATKLIEYFQSLSSGERKKRIKYLSSLDTDDPLTLSFTINLSFGSNGFERSPQDFKNRITPTEKYLSFAMLPFDRLELFKRTGDTLTKSESASADNAMIQFNKALNALRDSPIGQEYLRDMRQPQKMKEDEKLASYKAYAEKSIEISKEYPNDVAKYLDFDYTFNRITVTQAKLKDWAGLVESAKFFFSLPQELQYRGGSRANIENIERRLQKAEQELNKK